MPLGPAIACPAKVPTMISASAGAAERRIRPRLREAPPMTSQKNHEGVRSASKKNDLVDIAGIKLWNEPQLLPLRGSRCAKGIGGGKCFRNNISNHAVKIPKHVASAHAQRPHPLRSKPPITPLIPCGSEIMALPVNLDAEFCLVTVEVEYARTCWVLVAKAQASSLEPQLSPENSFRERHRCAQVRSE